MVRTWLTPALKLFELKQARALHHSPTSFTEYRQSPRGDTTTCTTAETLLAQIIESARRSPGTCRSHQGTRGVQL